MAKLSKMGDIMHELEAVIDKMSKGHDLQKGEVMALVSRYIDTHYPDSIEEYHDGTAPFEFYGHINAAKRKLNYRGVK